MSKNARPLGDSSCDQVLGERLAGDDVAADRDDPAAKRRRDPVGVAVRGDEDVARPDRPALRVHGEAAVGLAPDRPRPDALVQVRAGAIGGGGQPREVAAGMEEPAPRHDEAAVVRVGADLLADLVTRDHRRGDADRRQARLLLLEVDHVLAGPGELEVAAFAEVAVDRLLGDQALDRLVAVERVLVERRPELLAELPGSACADRTCSRDGRSRRCASRRPSRACSPRAG